ncbi:MAG: hypothetical protein Q8J76_03730 [Desulfobulbaceae bacterium]|nr:hypothetical protein [Desulfobulbaceae bacterium]
MLNRTEDTTIAQVRESDHGNYQSSRQRDEKREKENTREGI